MRHVGWMPTTAPHQCSSPSSMSSKPKLAKAEKHMIGDAPSHDAVLELEQAGDSAKAAAEADPGLSSDARESVLAAHLAICMLKAGA